jgi:hypothetical protein
MKLLSVVQFRHFGAAIENFHVAIIRKKAVVLLPGCLAYYAEPDHVLKSAKGGVRLTYDEIVKAARNETDNAVLFDMRKFPDAQAEAIETWLQNTGMGVRMNVLKHTKPIIILCDFKTAVSPRAEQLLAALKSAGVDVEIQRKD